MLLSLLFVKSNHVRMCEHARARARILLCACVCCVVCIVVTDTHPIRNRTSWCPNTTKTTLYDGRIYTQRAHVMLLHVATAGFFAVFSVCLRERVGCCVCIAVHLANSAKSPLTKERTSSSSYYSSLHYKRFATTASAATR